MTERKPRPEQHNEQELHQLSFNDLDKLRGDLRRERRLANRSGLLTALGITALCGGIYLTVQGAMNNSYTEMNVGTGVEALGVMTLGVWGFKRVKHAGRADRLDNALFKLIDRSIVGQMALPEGQQEATEYTIPDEPDQHEATMRFVSTAADVEGFLAAKGIDINGLRDISPIKDDGSNPDQHPQLPPADPQAPQGS